ncbi:methylated-DNA--[protein]-cysteine S-methyltransferase [Tannockella kyphosi]|uniref:methylated-DNA--[protein]-cysteine S-methyltransferase n=1 Tax=Tannockella kyphosi TaxID=2899121 RepID=UPI002011CCB0|nr:methylated-DNA--[protein]-cysteine S-methyltransferase [Tannockella kyphosi]
MTYAYYQSIIGIIEVGFKEEVVYSIKIKEKQGISNATKFSDFVFSQISQYLVGERKEFSFRYQLIGTEFQIKVWNALLTIPYGQTKSYQDIANAIDNPKACRAVGNANHHNPILLVIPCHRCIQANGKIGGFGLGIDIKIKLLRLEKGQ